VQPPPMRPRVSLRVPDHPDAVVASVKMWAAACPDCRIVTASSRHIVLSVADGEQHTWSPYLDLDVEAVAEGALVRGRFGPSPPVWAFFLAFYAVCVFVSIGGAMLGLSQWMIGQDPWALWGIPLAGLCMALAYAGALVGQRLGSQQMAGLRRTVSEALDDLMPTQGMVG
jgi:hypothetical protein